MIAKVNCLEQTADEQLTDVSDINQSGILHVANSGQWPAVNSDVILEGMHPCGSYPNQPLFYSIL